MNLRSIGITLISLAGIFVLGILLFNFVIMPSLIHQRESVIVPDVRNVSEAQAKNELEGLGLNMRVQRSEYHPSAPEGFVIEQRPAPNENIKEGRTIEVVLSLGARTQVVPDLKGMSLRQGRIMLGRNNLRIGRVARVHTFGGAGETVLATTPEGGKELVEGSSVDVVVAVGGQKQQYLMPDLTGEDLLFIREKLRGMGFRIGGVRYESRKDVFPNTVIGQMPLAGSLIREGDSIELVAASSE
ncbi:MAG: PASTA domain-containing protein [Candidatus Latescibacterota bacterium]|jgi:serine/threonine-protein kinase